jgi:basic membrane lipoprotein Med (substrate-binding protein (PBP1-ABC) superfamily)/DNA-binding SARP family transcriptional activator
VRRGGGYLLELGGATLDAQVFTREVDAARAAADAGDFARSREYAALALGLWRGAALADVSLASAGRAEAERLEELRLCACEVRFDAELALGRHEQVVGELRSLVTQNPYRERFVAHLMLALYRSGRHAEALEVYERLRASLDDDLGLQPSAELQKLSGQIVRQEPELQWLASERPSSAGQAIRSKAKRVTELVLVGVVVTAIMAFTASGSTAGPGTVLAPAGERVALVLPTHPDFTRGNESQVERTALAFDAALSSGVGAETLVTGDDPTSVVERIEDGGFATVLVAVAAGTQRELAQVARTTPDTRFVFLDNSLEALSLGGAPNVTAVRFAEEQSAHLAGYLAGLVAPLGGPRGARVDAVSVVASTRTSDVKHEVAGFVEGVRGSRPGVRVRVDYSGEVSDPTRCERLANEQIDAGSDVVYVAAGGKCGRGALVVARMHGVWAAGPEDNGAQGGPNTLVMTYKELSTAVTQVTERLANGVLPAGDVTLGLEDDYAVGVETSHLVSERLWSKVVERCSEIRRGVTAAEAP